MALTPDTGALGASSPTPQDMEGEDVLLNLMVKLMWVLPPPPSPMDLVLGGDSFLWDRYPCKVKRYMYSDIVPYIHAPRQAPLASTRFSVQPKIA